MTPSPHEGDRPSGRERRSDPLAFVSLFDALRRPPSLLERSQQAAADRALRKRGDADRYDSREGVFGLGDTPLPVVELVVAEPATGGKPAQDHGVRRAQEARRLRRGGFRSWLPSLLFPRSSLPEYAEQGVSRSGADSPTAQQSVPSPGVSSSEPDRTGTDADLVTRALVVRAANQPMALLHQAEDKYRTSPEGFVKESGPLFQTRMDVQALVDAIKGTPSGVPEEQARDRAAPEPPSFPRVESLFRLFDVFAADRFEQQGQSDQGGRLGTGQEIAQALRLHELGAWRVGRTAAIPGRPLTRFWRFVVSTIGSWIYRRFYRVLYEGLSLFWRPRRQGDNGKSSGRADLNFDLFDAKVLTPLGVVLNISILGLLVTGVTLNLPKDLVEGFTAILLLLVLGVYRLIGYVCWGYPWQPYRWLARQPYRLDTEADRRQRWGSRRAYRAVAERAGKEYAELVLSETGRTSADRIHQMRLLIVNAFLTDLDAAYGPFPWYQWRRAARARGLLRPALVVDRARTRWNGGDTVQDPTVSTAVGTARAADVLFLVEEIRTSQYFPDPLVVVVLRAEGMPPTRFGSRVPSRAEAPGRLADDVVAWQLLRRRLGRLGAGRTLSFDISASADQRRGENAVAAPTFLPTRSMRVRSAMPAAALLLALVLLAGVSVVAYDQSTGNECWWGRRFAEQPDQILQLPKPEGVQGPSPFDCVGFTDGSYVFHERLGAAQETIAEQNVQAEAGPHVTVVYFAALSVDDDTAQRALLAGVHGELVGLALRQREYNALRSDDELRIRILLANAGPVLRHGVEVAEAVAAEAARDPGVVAALGFGQSRQSTRDAISVLAKAGIPMIATTPTFDDIDLVNGRHSDFFFPLAPSNTRIATQAAAWAREGVTTDKGQLPRAERVAVFWQRSKEDLYGGQLASVFMGEFNRPGALGGGIPGGVALDAGYDPQGTGLRDTVRSVCQEEPDMVYYAGRSDQFPLFQDELLLADGCQGGVSIMAGDDIVKYVSDQGASDSDFPLYYTPLAADGGWGAVTEDDAGKGAFYGKFADLVAAIPIRSATPAERPSVPHGVMAYDALTVIGEALADARRNQDPADSAALPTGLAPSLLSGRLGVPGVSGYISYGTPGERGNWIEDKLIQLVLARLGAEPVTIAACGRVSDLDDQSEANLAANGCVR
ncbi:hypothetical protein [Nocardiopsis ansamitocini]|nr:hypothetical protein [Nocardiopsis ansamitocini]